MQIQVQDTQLPPEVSEVDVTGYAHCVNARCRGNKQEEVKAVKVTTTWTYAALGGDWPFPERSVDDYKFKNPDEAPCPHCGRSRSVTGQQRPSYDPLAEQELGLKIEPDALLSLQESGLEFDEKAKADAAENAELRERLAKLEGVLMGKAMAAEPEGD